IMPLKIPGKLNASAPQAEFDKLPLAKWCAPLRGVFYRLHGLNPKTGKPWHPVYFSQAGLTRFDPVGGTGTFYVGETLSYHARTDFMRRSQITRLRVSAAA